MWVIDYNLRVTVIVGLVQLLLILLIIIVIVFIDAEVQFFMSQVREGAFIGEVGGLLWWVEVASVTTTVDLRVLVANFVLDELLGLVEEDALGEDVLLDLGDELVQDAIAFFLLFGLDLIGFWRFIWNTIHLNKLASV